jgi:hypothetical protein
MDRRASIKNEGRGLGVGAVVECERKIEHRRSLSCSLALVVTDEPPVREPDED